jgi:Ran GTPase-activating protein (RanGAP) involved in mRNA processing and transport
MKLQAPPDHLCIAQPIDPAWLRALIVSLSSVPLFSSSIKAVLIQHADLGDRGAKFLAEELPRLTAVTAVDVIDCMVGPTGAADLATLLLQHRSGFALKSLRLDHNPLGDAGCASLAKGLARTATLTTFSLAYCDVGPGGVNALAAALETPIPALEPAAAKKKKKATKKATTGAGAARPATAAAEPVGASAAAAAALSMPRHEAAAAAAVAAAAAAEAAAASAAAKAAERPPLAPPMLLDMEGNPLGRNGAARLFYAAGDPSALRVHTLNVQNTGLASGGHSEQDLTAVVALVEALRSSPTLTAVKLGGNAVGDAGLKLLVDNVLELTHVTELDVEARGTHGPALAARLIAWTQRNALALAKKKKRRVVEKAATPGSGFAR